MIVAPDAIEHKARDTVAIAAVRVPLFMSVLLRAFSLPGRSYGVIDVLPSAENGTTALPAVVLMRSTSTSGALGIRC